MGDPPPEHIAASLRGLARGRRMLTAGVAAANDLGLNLCEPEVAAILDAALTAQSESVDDEPPSAS